MIQTCYKLSLRGIPVYVVNTTVPQQSIFSLHIPRFLYNLMLSHTLINTADKPTVLVVSQVLFLLFLVWIFFKNEVVFTILSSIWQYNRRQCIMVCCSWFNLVVISLGQLCLRSLRTHLNMVQKRRNCFRGWLVVLTLTTAPRLLLPCMSLWSFLD